jgi:hypothetical protein
MLLNGVIRQLVHEKKEQKLAAFTEEKQKLGAFTVAGWN